MTLQELSIEWQTEYQTRLGSLCGGGIPTVAQIDIATKETDSHIAKLKAQETP